MSLIKHIKTYIEYIRIAGANEIARRYFIMNSFDGAVTILGMLLGALLTGLTEVSKILDIAIATALALLISGLTGTLIAEEAERDKTIRELEESMLTDLSDTLFERAQRFAIIYVSIIDGIAAFFTIILASIPLYLSIIGFLSPTDSLIYAIILCIAYLGVLGIFIGELTNRSRLIESIKLIGVGLITTIIVSILLGVEM